MDGKSNLQMDDLGLPPFQETSKPSKLAAVSPASAAERACANRFSRRLHSQRARS